MDKRLFNSTDDDPAAEMEYQLLPTYSLDGPIYGSHRTELAGEPEEEEDSHAEGATRLRTGIK